MRTHFDSLRIRHHGLMETRSKLIWIDLDNSPHVPFFKPIIRELEKLGYRILVTSRDCFQVAGLCKLHKLPSIMVGRHYGKNKLRKLLGLLIRSLQLMPSVILEKPDLAVSHGSRSELLLATFLRIPSVLILDYEFTSGNFPATWKLIPEVVPMDRVTERKGHVLTYPGIKEDVYAPEFRPDSSILSRLGLNPEDIIVTVRTPANEAHYHNPESEKLLAETIVDLSEQNNVKIILLPRSRAQEKEIREQWKELFTKGKMMIPEEVVDGLNLIWHSDFVISGGGTMNREAAALGVPVYSIFRGKIGAVDKYLADTGRLVLLERIDMVRSKLRIEKRVIPTRRLESEKGALRGIVDAIVGIIENRVDRSSTL
jgi:uncharacterized protein